MTFGARRKRKRFVQHSTYFKINKLLISSKIQIKSTVKFFIEVINGKNCFALVFLWKIFCGKMAFSPKVYDFVLSKEFSDSILYWGLNNYKVQRPKYSVLLDHTLGVIWHIFNQNGAELITLNKSQLIWALRFLEAIDVSKVPDNTDLQSVSKLSG